MSYLCISQDGSIAKVKKRMTLKQMQNWVGGYIEEHDGVICNEDGIRFGLLSNVSDERFLGNIIFTERSVRRHGTIRYRW